MNITNKKQELLFFYKTLVEESLNTHLLNKNELEKEVEKLIKALSLDKNDYETLKTEIIENLKKTQYSIYTTQFETIIHIITTSDPLVKIEHKTNDIDPAIYYYKNNNLYLINYDCIEDKWYLSLIDKSSLSLIKEIYSETYNYFIEYLKNKKAIE